MFRCVRPPKIYVSEFHSCFIVANCFFFKINLFDLEGHVMLFTRTLSLCSEGMDPGNQWQQAVPEQGEVVCPTCSFVTRKSMEGLKKHMEICHKVSGHNLAIWWEQVLLPCSLFRCNRLTSSQYMHLLWRVICRGSVTTSRLMLVVVALPLHYGSQA